MDKRVHFIEREDDGACAECGRRHIHRDDCSIMLEREARNDGTDPDKPPVPYAGGMQS